MPCPPAPLPTSVIPDDAESVEGFLIRVARANHITVPQLLGRMGIPSRRALNALDIDMVAWMTQVPRSWIEHRVPIVRRNGDGKALLFVGQMWGAESALRRHRQQVCPKCIRENGFARLTWDVTRCSACPEHGIVLQDHCPHCGRSIDPHRPALDVCVCKHVLFGTRLTPQAAELPLLAWCEWVSHALVPTQPPGSLMPREAQRVLEGMSVGGASTLVAAFAGGKRESSFARFSAVQPWMPTTLVAQQTSLAVHRFLAFATGRRLESEHQLAIDDILKLASHGLTATDRARAIWLLTALKGRRVSYRRIRAATRQPDLFSDLQEGEGP